MKRTLVAILALAAASCTAPVAPTAPAGARPLFSGEEGGATGQAIAVDRLRLRRVNGPDIVTSLVTGQVIDVPLNVKLDIWAEIRRLEADRARVIVNWGNGNNDFNGCGICRVENTYAQAGRYPVTASVIDLNAPGGTAPILTVTVTLVAQALPEPLPTPCTTATSFVGNLNGTSTASTFQTGTDTPLPSLGWTNVSSTARIWNSIGGNGALIHQNSPWGNYQVQHDTGVSVKPSTTYKLTLDMGYVAGWANGNSAYSLELGTVTGGLFTALGTAVTGNAPYAGNIFGGSISGSAQQTFTTGASASSGTMALRWAQTSAIAVSGYSDWFGIDNVVLTATGCVP